MYPTVRVVQPNRTQIYLVVAEPIVIGRECDGLLLADEKVSRQHLRLAPSGESVAVTDLGSTNGSFINQQRLSGDAVLTVGGALTLGDTIITIEVPQPPGRTSGETTRRDVGGTIVATLPRSTAPLRRLLPRPRRHRCPPQTAHRRRCRSPRYRRLLPPHRRRCRPPRRAPGPRTSRWSSPCSGVPKRRVARAWTSWPPASAVRTSTFRAGARTTPSRSCSATSSRRPRSP